MADCACKLVVGSPGRQCDGAGCTTPAGFQALRAENERLRIALADLLSWFPAEPSPPEWRLVGGVHGADDAVAAARAAITKEPT